MPHSHFAFGSNLHSALRFAMVQPWLCSNWKMRYRMKIHEYIELLIGRSEGFAALLLVRAGSKILNFMLLWFFPVRAYCSVRSSRG